MRFDSKTVKNKKKGGNELVTTIATHLTEKSANEFRKFCRKEDMSVAGAIREALEHTYGIKIK